MGWLLFDNSTNTVQYSDIIIRMLYEVILSQRADAKVTINTSINTFPRAKFRITGYDVVAANVHLSIFSSLFIFFKGGVWFFIPPMIIFFTLLVEIVGEKETRQRIGMRMMGLKRYRLSIFTALTIIQFCLLAGLVPSWWDGMGENYS